MPAYANGQRHVSKGGPERERTATRTPRGDTARRLDAQGRRLLRLPIHMAVCTETELPLAWNVRTARANESSRARCSTVRAAASRPRPAAMDKGYDIAALYDDCEERGMRPVIPLRQTPDVKRGADKPPTCEHGEWRFAGTDYSRKAPSGAARPASASPPRVWVKADRLHPLIPRETPRFASSTGAAPPSSASSAGSRTNGRSLPLRVRGLDRVKLHADLTILAKLACALSRARTVQLAA